MHGIGVRHIHYVIPSSWNHTSHTTSHHTLLLKYSCIIIHHTPTSTGVELIQGRFFTQNKTLQPKHFILSMHVLILKGKGREWGPVYREYLGIFTHGKMRFAEVDTSDISAVNDMIARCEYDGYVLTGSTGDAHDSEDYVLNLIERVKELHARKAKIIGICYGHQVLFPRPVPHD